MFNNMSVFAREKRNWTDTVPCIVLKHLRDMFDKKNLNRWRSTAKTVTTRQNPLALGWAFEIKSLSLTNT